MLEDPVALKAAHEAAMAASKQYETEHATARERRTTVRACCTAPPHAHLPLPLAPGFLAATAPRSHHQLDPRPPDRATAALCRPPTN